MNEVYSFEYNSCIFESAYETISMHRTKKGAYDAMRRFILKKYNSWRDLGIRCGKQRFKFGWSEEWRVDTIKIED